MDPTSQVDSPYGKYILAILSKIGADFQNIQYNVQLDNSAKASILSSYSRAIEAVMLGGRFPVPNTPTTMTPTSPTPIINLEGLPAPGLPERVG